MDSDQEWKKSVGFPINFSPDTTDDDYDNNDVVMRHPRHSAALLADDGDGAQADLLGTTPPRQRIRENKKRRTVMEAAMLRDRRTADDYVVNEQSMADRPRNRLSMKLQRSRDRDHKLDMGQREPRADSLPSPNPMAAVPTLVESCSRFMSLTSRLKCRETDPQSPEESEIETRAGGVTTSLRGLCPSVGFDFPGDTAENDVLASRVNFHKTFSMLINMGNIDKGCRRTISREEQVWQNELKDLIWLELQAKIAGRTLAEQDAFLCTQRNVVPAIVSNIRDYRFMNTNPCRTRSRLRVIAGSAEDVRGFGAEDENEGSQTGCLSFNCQQCTEAVGRAMQEVGTLLDSFYNAAALYPSSHAMTQEHPLTATQLFKNRLKAMCLWYNTAMHMRLKMLAVRRMIRTMKHKTRRPLSHLASTESDLSRQSSECQRPSQVRFNVSITPTDSSNSDSSAQTDVIKETDEGSESDQSRERAEDKVKDSGSGHCGKASEEQKADENKTEESKDDADSSVNKRSDQTGPETPEIVISDSRYGTADTVASTESGYTSSPESDVSSHTDSVFHIGSLEDLTNLKLLDKCQVSIYRSYHYEILKTQGVRRCMQFMQKMRSRVLDKVLMTLEKPDGTTLNACKEENEEVFEDTKEEDFDKIDPQDEEAKKMYELRRYGCWSAECMSMGLPSYRPHFLLLATICMEAVHDYLSLRLEDRPQAPSCLTVKQLIHELKEGLDIATETRAAFARNIEVALTGQAVDDAARRDLLLIVRTFDNTVETVLKQYLSYLRTMSAVEAMPRSCLQAEWTFTARLARRVRCAARLAPLTFTEIACNQLDRLHTQFKQKFEQLHEFGKAGTDDKQWVYAMCRAVQHVYAAEREPTLHAAQWARALAARLQRAPPPAYTAQRDHIFESLMRIRDLLVHQTKLILEKSRPDGRADDIPYDSLEIIMARVRELMLQIYKLGFELHKELHRFVHDPSRQPLCFRRPLNVNSSPPKSGRVKLFRSDSVIEDAESNLFEDRLFDPILSEDHQSSIELLLTGKQAQPEEEPVELRSGGEVTISQEEKEWAKRVARAVVEFAKCWMQFVVERCETGRGLRPRWACQGLEFLMLACDPCNTRHLSEEEFDDLKRKMDGCISHVIGSRNPQRCFDSVSSTPDHHPKRRPRIHSPLPSTGSAPQLTRPAPAPPTPPAEPEPVLDFQPHDPAQHSARVLEAVRQVDLARDEKLRDMRSVGRVVEAQVDSYEPKLRQLKFKWQRGLKIGAGTFGKVYTVVNTESGQLLAMKELNIGAGDRRALQRAANELRVLEGVIHPHLVRYYGCEVHREEMLIFMELCVEGSLEALIATSGALAEHMVRRYTKQLVSAVAELHARSIAHRDIKSGNIFLTNEGHCLKLGDFGCAVKIRAHTTAAGELMGHVGTQAYMAPEVFMKPTGHGRAADIWSLGCVVTEMASGKRPFSEYDSNVQIMFVVGMGGRPAIPDCLSEEGQQFCAACLTHEPEQRPPAQTLSLHHFLKLQSDDDCKCEPAFLIT
ncbi:mitogen-activated protein kinase kinase kinase 4 isoform X2 [Pectinophora gossypiella]|uniref:mitogen-activated protein kinase kinase kinase 4 isoform X2 n=1 Tax=Pectinophora gossypiella TaxID=13191 RepID=UPI00214ECFA9|nr:mitogen-activated protein kinase kinase kinase 4 isoform X2 [Pectinophora gossypiella]